MNPSILRISTAVAVVLGAVSLAACGSSSGSSAAPATSAPATTAPATTAPAATTPAGTTVAVTLGGSREFSIAASPSSVAAGPVTFHVDDAGAITHEMVVVRTAARAADLAPAGSSRADESGSAGETGDMAAGATKDLTLTLPAGHYVLLCNLPGHYAGGMHTDLTVRAG